MIPWRVMYAHYVDVAALAGLSESAREVAECELTVTLEAFLEQTGLNAPEPIEQTPIHDNLKNRRASMCDCLN